MKTSLLADIAAAADEAAIEAVRVAALGKKGSVSELLKTLGSMTPGRAPDDGPGDQRAEEPRHRGARPPARPSCKDAAITARLAAETVDVTLPVRPSPAERGRIHPISQVIDEITAIFGDLGFSIAEGPDIETDYYNFTALNFPDGHPAREMHDTFFFQPDENGERKLLRTHTSPVQIRTMETQKPPIRIVIPGKTYRQDSRRHPLADVPSGRGPGDRQDGQRRQHEVGAGGVLQGLLRGAAASRCASARASSRSPSRRLEVDIQCDRSRPGEVRFGEGTDWMEILGCGMVHPNVLRPAGSIRTSTRALPGAWASTASPC